MNFWSTTQDGDPDELLQLLDLGTKIDSVLHSLTDLLNDRTLELISHDTEYPRLLHAVHNARKT